MTLETKNNFNTDASLIIAREVAEILKVKWPNQVMPLTSNTVIMMSKENQRLTHGIKSMNKYLAFYTCKKPHRIIISEKFLQEREGWLGTRWYSIKPVMETVQVRYRRYCCDRCGLKFPESWNYKTVTKRVRLNGRKGPVLNGVIALVELMCHELAHHQTKGHGRGFKIKYARFWNYMVEQIRSGKFVVPEYEKRQLEEAIASIKAPIPIACA